MEKIFELEARILKSGRVLTVVLLLALAMASTVLGVFLLLLKNS